MKPKNSESFKVQVKEIVSKIYEFGGYSEIIDGFLYYRLSKPELFLNWLVLGDYLLHGSTKAINENLKPYQAIDKIKESGNKKAIYITKIPAVAMFCAITGGVDGLLRRHLSHTRMENGKIQYKNMYFAVNDMNKVAENGYIYIIANRDINEDFRKRFHF